MPRSVSVPALRALLSSQQPPIILDVRRAQAFEESPEVIPGATRHLPESVDSWVEELPPHCEVVAYCVLGQQVSQGVVARLEQRGIKASFLEGGIEQWRADGGALLPAEPARPVDALSPAKPGDAGQAKP